MIDKERQRERRREREEEMKRGRTEEEGERDIWRRYIEDYKVTRCMKYTILRHKSYIETIQTFRQQLTQTDNVTMEIRTQIK